MSGIKTKSTSLMAATGQALWYTQAQGSVVGQMSGQTFLSNVLFKLKAWFEIVFTAMHWRHSLRMHFHHAFRDLSVAKKCTWVREVVRLPFPFVHQKISMFIACCAFVGLDCTLRLVKWTCCGTSVNVYDLPKNLDFLLTNNQLELLQKWNSNNLIWILN